MTGHGQASVERDQVRVIAEIRSVNNRFLKTSVYSELGSNVVAKVESQVSGKVHRGTVTVRIKTVSLDNSRRYRLNEQAIRQYWLQLTEIAGSSQSVNVESILALPGVVVESEDDDLDELTASIVEECVDQALDRLNSMRRVEGEAMKADMLANIDSVGSVLVLIKDRAPAVAQQYSERMTERINRLLSTYDVSVTPADIVKEVGIFADRCDISEETVRLDSHLKQFAEVIDTSDHPGKKLDFLVQEMLRETNTIGSKANDAEIAVHVVEIKTRIERIREMVQNIE